MKLNTLYFVVTDYGKNGIGNAGDATADRDLAYSNYCDAIGDDQPARAFMMQFDIGNSELEITREITSDFRDEYVYECIDRDLPISNIIGEAA
ncbi:hypothetical protein OU789_10955 [Halocynthiibacter sp. C4]|uniref:hypothetical protein n=1 Tax=Halocynthiibacter sp. C4 TaxID=2992758 RepID=UPI00237A1FF3|nr:hypothetical protein [Halocynthiibacter sp. C4]MDE0590446.1 hypothetical protein [Halocynthiibacter sp. C4]